LRELEDAAKFPAWLLRIAHIEVLAALRKSKLKKQVMPESKFLAMKRVRGPV
jgi:DNA-directed RNA polymerase specialized sigma24 family protein